MNSRKRYGWIGCLLLSVLMAGCLPYEDVNDAIEDPEEASYAFGTLNDMAWASNSNLGIDVGMHLRKGKIYLVVYGIQEFSTEVYWDGLSIWGVSWGEGVTNTNLNHEDHPEDLVEYDLIEHDVSVARYELDKTQENYLKMSPMWGSADYTGELEVHLVKTWSVDYAPPTPDTLHLVVKEFRATRLK